MEYNTAFALAVDDPSQVGEARRIAAGLTERMGMSETARGHVALAVTEAGTNLVRHAGGGQLVLQPVTQSGGVRCFDVYALDKGPGMNSVAESMRDGFSTGGSAGEGLGAIRRLAVAFDVYSVPEQGTVLFARIADEAGPAVGMAGRREAARRKAAAACFGAICLPVSPEMVCGDAWAMDLGTPHPGDNAPLSPNRFLLADGLGHGSGAAEAAEAAVRIFEDGPWFRSPARTLETAHRALRATRGAAVSMVSVEGERLTFAGIGNVQAILVDRETGQTKSLTAYNGIVGHQAQRFAEFGSDVKPGTLLILASDGLTTLGKLDRYPGLLFRHPAVIAGTLFRDGVRGRDDATVLVVDMTAMAGAAAAVSGDDGGGGAE